ncbi:hypothetical protein LTR62_002971 [Meristemomyces frigidus]|uniref:Zn(2)-C6 fungal-type domain-containing protein n=1 Tax=Meristemomyces frigidus TaxID=1508187 RepID=A0AAN7TID9_9PEZI|nr:hypothetical protein LTR62_002971 [Meristemomyces frigidus]
MTRVSILCTYSTTPPLARNAVEMQMNKPSTRRVAAEKRKRTETSCDICKARKQKCNRTEGQAVCQYCQRQSLACATTQPRKQRLYGSLETLGTRIRLLEALTKGLVPEAEVSSNQDLRRLGDSLGIPLPEETPGGVVASQASPHSPTAEEEVLPLVPDQQGQSQYIGPASSFSYHLRLRSLFESDSTCEFALFGPNAAGQHDTANSVAQSSVPGGSVTMARDHRDAYEDDPDGFKSDVECLDDYVNSYFERFHPDFPVLHEATFRASFEVWLRTKADSERAWLVSCMCICILGSKLNKRALTVAQETSWWKQIQRLLPTVLFTTNIAAVQALSLVAVYLHHNNHRDACWNITGAAVRIAHALGLHNEKTDPHQSPLQRELRKSLWWVLLGIEQLQISSYDRPSAIDITASTVSPPDDRILGMGSYYPPDYMKWSARLAVLLAAACRARRSRDSRDERKDVLRPLSPTASVLRDVQRWHESMPSHLRSDMIYATAPCYIRPMLLLEIQRHYTIIVLTRSALLHRATKLAHTSTWLCSSNLSELSRACTVAGTSLAHAILAMNDRGCLNTETWFDIFYSITAALSLALDVVCCIRMRTSHVDSIDLLGYIAEMVQRRLRTKPMPSTLKKWSTLIVELTVLVKKYCSSQSVHDNTESRGLSFVKNDTNLALQDAQLLMGLQQDQRSPRLLPKATTSFTTASTIPRLSAPSELPTGMPVWNSAAFAEGDHFSTDTLHDWCWEDIEAILNG